VQIRPANGNANWIDLTNKWGSAWEISNAPPFPLDVNIVGTEPDYLALHGARLAQGAQLMSQYGINVPPGIPVKTLEELPAAVEKMKNAEDLVRDCLERIGAREPQVQAWSHVARQAALARAKVLDDGAHQGLLHGLPIGVKDLIDTAGAPATYGSPIYKGHRPAWDAPCVVQAKLQGAVVVGKTVTTEFAIFHPGKTANPHNLAHTPGGSSSGSAAAVADLLRGDQSGRRGYRNPRTTQARPGAQ
jgi:hypothetical protein